MRGGPAFAGQHTLGSNHSVHIIRLCEGANHDDFLLFILGHLLGLVGIEVDLANGRTRGGIHALDIVSTRFFGSFQGRIVELRVEQSVHIGK